MIIVAVIHWLGVFELLTLFGRSRAVAQLPGPADSVLVAGATSGSGRPHPARGEFVLSGAPVLPAKLLRSAVIVHQQLVLGVDGIFSVLERELEQLGLGDGLGGTGFYAQVTVDAAQIVDLVDEPESFARRTGIIGRIVGATDVDALGRADTGTQFAS
jgi:hypothetical protein